MPSEYVGSFTIGLELNTLTDHSTKKARINKDINDLYLITTTHANAQNISWIKPQAEKKAYIKGIGFGFPVNIFTLAISCNPNSSKDMWIIERQVISNKNGMNK